MAAERRSPNGVFEQTNYTGSVFDVDEPVDSPDGNWYTIDDPTLEGRLRLRLSNPTVGSEWFLADKARQEFRLYVRRTNNGAGNPTVDIELRRAGTTVKTLVSGYAVSSTSGEVIEDLMWDNDDFGAVFCENDVIIHIVANSDGTDNVEIGAVEWLAKTSEHTFIPDGYIDDNNNLSGTASDIDEDPSTNDGNWLTADNTNNSTDVTILYENTDHGRNVVSAPNNETARLSLRVRQTDNIGGNDPEMDVWIYEGGTAEQLLDPNRTVTDAIGEVHNYFFSPDDHFTDLTLNDMRTFIDVTDGGISGSTIEYGSFRIWAAMEAPAASDTGTSTEVESVIKPQSKADSDIGSGTDVSSFAAKALFDSDVGASTESADALIPKSGSDTGTGTEAETLLLTDPGRRTPNSTQNTNNVVSGDHTDLDDHPEDPDNNWVVFDETATSGFINLLLTDNPNGNTWAPQAVQTVRIYARRKNNTGDAPTVKTQIIRDNGSQQAEYLPTQTVTSSSGQLLEFKFRLSDLTPTAGWLGQSTSLNNVHLRVSVESNGDNTDTVDLGAVDWLSRVQVGNEYVAIDYNDSNVNLTGTVSAVDDDPENPDGSWITADSDNTETDANFQWGDFTSVGRDFFVHPITPSENMHVYRAYLRRTDNVLANDDIPNIEVFFREGSGTTRDSGGLRNVSSDTGELETFYWHASNFSDLTPDLWVFHDVSSVGTNGNTVEYGALRQYIMFDGFFESDSGSGTEAETRTVQLTDTDSGTGVDAESAPTASIVSSESASATETATPDAVVADADATTGQDAETLAAVLPTQTDTASGVDADDFPSALFTETDSGTTTESSTKNNLDPDFGFGAEAETLIVSVSDTDDGTSTEDAPLPTVQRADSDTGAGAEAQALETEDSKLGFDSGTSNEFETLTVSFTETDTNSTFIDEVVEFLRRAGAVTDSGTGLEAGQLRTDTLGVKNPLQVVNLVTETNTVGLEDASDTVDVTGSTTTAVLDTQATTTVRIR